MKKMKYGTTYEQGDIVLIPYPFTDLSGIKKRPVMVLSNKKYNQKSEDVVTCGITSNIKDQNFSIVIEQKDLTTGMLPKTSSIKPDKIFSLDKSLIIKKLGKVNADIIGEVKIQIFRLLD
jgi:mRNA interferase MazF